MADITITSLQGGLNDSPSLTSLDADQCTVATNVEFDIHPLGSRRLGCTPIDSPSFGDEVVFLHRHLPSDDPQDAQLFVLGVDGSSPIMKYKDTSWHNVIPSDAITVTRPERYEVDAVTFHEQMFIAYKGKVGRFHVWDGTELRPTGLVQPEIVSTADTGGAGSFIGTRYYRQRIIKMSGSTILLRSEPSESYTHIPSGTNLSVTITRPTPPGEGETHWELEASIDNVIFNVLATTIIATATVVDTTDYVAGYTGELSEDIGDYALLPSARFVVADDDRLLFAGSFDDETLASRFSWTPVFNDPGVGNAERSPIDTDNFKDLNTSEGGPITGMSRTVNGYIYIFKLSHIYQAVRTGLRARAYDVSALSKVRGALRGSIVEGVDQNGKPCLYFTDPTVGPCRIGEGGIQTCSRDIQETWKTVNLDSVVTVRSLFYPDQGHTQQVHWWLATGDEDYPDKRLMLQTNETRQVENGIRRGWTSHDGFSATALCACLFSENIDDDTDRSLVLRPFIGMPDGTIQRCDTGNTDAGVAYASRIVTAPLASAGFLNKFGILAGALVAKAAEGVEIVLSAIRNFNTTTLADERTVDLSPEGTEATVIKPLDDFSFEGCTTLQLEFADTDTPQGEWNLDVFAMKPAPEETA